MEHGFEFLKELVNPESIIRYGGVSLLLFVVFAETGLFVGFFLPGDSLMFTAGLLCSTGIIKLPVAELIVLLILAAVSGNMVGYAFGKKVGPFLFKRKSGIFFRHDHLVIAQEFYIKHGRKALILSRFLPIVRTFAPIVAGIVKLGYIKFFFSNLIGAILWVNMLVLIGFTMGHYLPGTKDYLHYIVIFLIVITTIPFLVNYLKKRREARKLKKFNSLLL
jgi:membrane-associated protein